LRPPPPRLCPLQAGDSPLDLGPKAEASGTMNTNPLSFLLRLLLGTTAGFYYFVVPVYMFIKNAVWPKDWEM
jgi:MPBQ/MSBQ methyltransferase